MPKSLAHIKLACIEQAVSVCRNCALHKSRKKTVFGCGNPKADWLFVGEAPGKEEDIKGEPFVGRAGKQLNMMITELGMQREQVFITNVVKCRPPGNRDLLRAEIKECKTYLDQQIKLIKPKIIVALGNISARALLDSDDSLATLRGKKHQYKPGNIPLIVMYHPVLWPQQQPAFRDDLRRVRCTVFRERWRERARRLLCTASLFRR